MNLSFQRALLLVLAATTVLALVPAALALDRRLAAALEQRVRRDLALAPRILEDRESARADVLKMHAMDLAAVAGLADALAAGARDRAARLLEEAPLPGTEQPVLLGPAGQVWVGPPLDPEAVDRVREGAAMSYGYRDGVLHSLSLVPVERQGRRVGWAGVQEAAGQGTSITLSALTGSQVAILGRQGPVAATFDTAVARALSAAVPPGASEVRDISVSAGRFWVTRAPLGEVGSVLFARSAAQELALLPGLRRGAATAGLLALVLFLLLGAVLSSVLSRRVSSLARAADRLAAGDFAAPLEGSRIREMDRLAAAFDRMRSALAARLEELGRANRELEDRQARLSALQAEMMQRDRLVASGRLVAELAHEIRNPVANVRNCLEVIHRRLDKDPEVRRFADLAIDELLRMHELSEQMLDLNRPIDPGASRCDVGDVIDQVAALYRAGERSRRWSLRVSGSLTRPAAIGPDALKQVLLNLMENAREAMVEGGTIEIGLADEGELLAIEVTDEGPGISVDDLPRIFDPFFTTKGGLRGTGLGLFVAEGLVRRVGGRVEASNRSDRQGARFRIELLPTEPQPVSEGKEPTTRMRSGRGRKEAQ